tara:strand:- start:870 stop:1046 length:177 start_codon:yes stop_codon:yes gene_type:complete
MTKINRTIKFGKSPRKGKYFMEPKLLDYLIEKFTKETKCKFLDFYIINNNKIVLSGII